LATTGIHHPFTPHPQFKGTSGCGRYGDFIHELDWIVGEVMKELEKQGVAENTLVVFTSDNGGMLNQGGQDAWVAGHTLTACYSASSSMPGKAVTAFPSSPGGPGRFLQARSRTS
jgi:arylsulfatase A-like enzyme